MITLYFPNGVVADFDRGMKKHTFRQKPVGTISQIHLLEAICSAIHEKMDETTNDEEILTWAKDYLGGFRPETLPVRERGSGQRPSNQTDAQYASHGDINWENPSTNKKCCDCNVGIGTSRVKCQACWALHPHQESAARCNRRPRAIDANQCFHRYNGPEPHDMSAAERQQAGIDLDSERRCPDCGVGLLEGPQKCWPCYGKHPHPAKAEDCLASSKRFTPRCEASTEVGESDESRSEHQDHDHEEENDMASAKTPEQLQKEQDEMFKEVGISRTEDAMIRLPKKMTFRTAINWLSKMERADTAEMDVNEIFDCDPFEGVLAMTHVLREKFGWTQAVPTPTMFGPQPPDIIQVHVDHDKSVSVPWGRMEVPGIRGFFAPSVAYKNNRPHFQMTGNIRQGDADEWKDIILRLRKRLGEQSIYKGKAFRLKFPDPQSRPQLVDFAPEFLKVDKIKREELVLRQDIASVVNHSLFTPIIKRDRLRRENIPRKRGVLLAGKFGTGKTLTALVVAMLCVKHGWTFIMIDDASKLPESLDFALRYGPAVVFCEDVDRKFRGDRDEEMDRISIALDGLKSKGGEVMVVLTTNEIKTINPLFMRPGRIDVIVPFHPPDAEAAIGVVRLYARNAEGTSLLVEGEDLGDVGRKLDGSIPAVIREVVERSKLGAISRLEDDEPLVISAADLVSAATEMEFHKQFIDGPPLDERHDLEKIGAGIGQGIMHAATKNKNLVEGVNSLLRRQNGVHTADAE